MHSELKKRTVTRKKRALRVRKRLKGNSVKPRMNAFKSNQHLFVQLIDDSEGQTLFGVGTCSKELKEMNYNKKSKAAAKHLGNLIAQKAKEKGIDEVVFDRGPYKYHGLIAEIASAAREGGLQF